MGEAGEIFYLLYWANKANMAHWTNTKLIAPLDNKNKLP